MKLESLLRSLSRREPLSFEEIGLILGMKRQNVHSTYRRAMAKIRARLRLAGVQ